MRKKILFSGCLFLIGSILAIYVARHVSDLSASLETPIARAPRVVIGIPDNDATTEPVVTGASSPQINRGGDISVRTNSSVAENVESNTLATAEISKETNEQDNARFLREIRELAAKNPEAALASVMKLPGGEKRDQALMAVCYGLAQTDPADAVRFAHDLHLDKQPGPFVENLVQQWAATDLSSALNWVDTQAESSQRDGLISRISYVASQKDPVNAANLVLYGIPPGPAQNEAVMTVINQWGNQDMAAAATWVSHFPAGQLQERAIKELEGISSRQQAAR